MELSRVDSTFDQQPGSGVFGAGAPNRAARAVGNDTAVANRAGPAPRRASRDPSTPVRRGAVPALRARIPHASVRSARFRHPETAPVTAPLGAAARRRLKPAAGTPGSPPSRTARRPRRFPPAQARTGLHPRRGACPTTSPGTGEVDALRRPERARRRRSAPVPVARYSLARSAPTATPTAATPPPGRAASRPSPAGSPASRRSAPGRPRTGRARRR